MQSVITHEHISLAMEESEFLISVNIQSEITEELTPISMEQSVCTIYRVHKHLRSVNDKAYDPRVIAIGPYHHGSKNLEMLEKRKLPYFNLLLKHKNQNRERYVSAIKRLEKKARKCYDEDISLTSAEFIDMLVLDGCFIIKLLRNMDFIEYNDPILLMPWMQESLQRDLMLFENQIPFFILLELYDLIEVPNEKRTSLTSLLFKFFQKYFGGNGYEDNSSQRTDKIKHILDLFHGNWLPPSSGINIAEELTGGKYIDSATELVEANVEFKIVNEVSLFHAGFENGKMSLAYLRIGDRTEAFFRNMIVYEQYFQDFETSFVTDYVVLMDCLIDTPKDVEILSRCKIINNIMGDDQAVVDVFNKLTDEVTFRSKNNYARIFESVNKHCRQPKNKYIAVLRHKHFHNPWAIISIIAGSLLLILTIIQTVFSILN